MIGHYRVGIDYRDFAEFSKSLPHVIREQWPSYAAIYFHCFFLDIADEDVVYIKLRWPDITIHRIVYK